MAFDCVIVAAHPDDAEIGMGGTIAALIAADKKILVVDLTNGEPTPFGTPEKRQHEWEQASHVLGLKNRINLRLINRELKDDIVARKALAEVFREYKPKIIFAPYFEDAHPDHLAASQLTMAARFYAKFEKSDLAHSPHYPGKVIYYFSTHMHVKFEPTFIFDISKEFEIKIAALKEYRSQFVENSKNSQIFERLTTFNSFWGQQSGCQYGEPFLCRETIKIDNCETLLNV